MTATASNYDEISMQQSMIFSDSLKELKNIRKQLYSAAEYFELSYINDDKKQITASTLRDYVVKALVNTVDHLGSVTYKVTDLLDEKFDEAFGAELRVSGIEQRLRTCQNFIDREGLSQQSLVISTPKYHKRYILPAGEKRYGGSYQECSPNNERQFPNVIRATNQKSPSSLPRKEPSPSPLPKLSQQYGNFSFSNKMPNKDLEKRSESPRKFPLLRSGSLSSKLMTSKSPNSSTKNQRRSTTPTPNFGRELYISEPMKSPSMKVRVEKDKSKDTDQHHTSKSTRLLKSLLSRRKSKKDDVLYTYLDEY